jgi:peptide/nickel transport system substrate-binding protein
MSDDGSRAGLSRRDVLQRGAAGAVVLGAGGVLAACGGGSSTPGTTKTASGGPATGGTPVRGGTVTIGWIGGGPTETLIPGHGINNSDAWRFSQLFDPLFFLGPDGRPVPYLAESAEPNADGTKWTIKVRDGVTWHDGKSLTAEDIAAAIKSWVDPKSYYGAVAASLIDVGGVRARGPLTVEVPMKLPVGDFPGITAYFAYYITRPDIYKKGAKFIGTGPYKYESFTPGKRSVFTANKDYWGVQGGPYIERQIVDSSFTDDNARLNALLSGAIDIAPSLPFGLAKANANSGQIAVGHATGADNMYVSCRVDLAPFKDPRVMQALKLLIDRPQMVQSVFSGYAEESNDLQGFTLPQFPSPDVFPVRKYDPEQAKSLLKAAGHENLKLTLYTSHYASGMVEGATAYAQQAAAGGVKIKTVTVDPSIYYTSQGPAGGYFKYPMMVSSSSGGGWLPAMNAYYLVTAYSKSTTPETHFGDAQTDKLLFDAIGELDQTKAQEKWNTFLKPVYERGGWINFGNIDYVDGYSKKIRGVQTGKNGWVNNFAIGKAWLQ